MGMYGQPPMAAPQQSLQSAGSGIAYSGALWFAGLATSAAGFVTIGNFMRRVAVIQGFGQVALGGLVAYQDPTVRRIIDAQTAKVSEKAAPESDRKIDAKSLRSGSRVTLAGLRTTAELNG